MFGVVLWCDALVSRAVIWCEDHGDLAYFRRADTVEPVQIDAGDWVQFDVTTGCDMRYAHNPRLVAEGVFAGLADNLKGVNVAGRPTAGPPAAPAAEVIRIAPRLARRRRGSAGKTRA